MRIRKRFLSLSAAVKAQPSLDLHDVVHHPPLLLVQQPELHPNGNLRVLYDNSKSQPFDRPQPPSSDHTTQIGLRPSTWLSSGAAGSDQTDLIVKESEKKKDIIKNNDSGRKESIILFAEASGDHLVSNGWLERHALIPIKKRRGSFGKRVRYHDLLEDNEMTEGTTKPKLTKTERCVATQEVGATSPKKNKKNGKRGNVIMEGSRCSRVNGRGWRCCQETLVGYSLCEHHLGKGRLRSMTSIRSCAQKFAPIKQDKESEDDHIDEEEDEFVKDSEENSSSAVEAGTKKCSKKKLGVIKARSLSSLLSQISS